MAVGKVTVAALRGLEGWLWDTHCVGFGARRQTNGIFYYVRYRHLGSQIVRSLGRHGPMTPDIARAKARQLLGVVAGGTNPFTAREGDAFAATLDRYLNRRRAALRTNSFAELVRYLRDYSAPLHRLCLGEIDRRRVAALLGEIETASGSASRNRARSALSAFFAWCVAEGLLDTNPVAGTAKADEGGSRERVLTPDELRKLSHSLGADRFSDIVRLLLLTGQRRNEIGWLRWSEIDLAARMVVLPPERTKNSRQHEVPLSSQALAILVGLPRRNSSEFLFGSRGFSDWGHAKAKLDQHLPMGSWRLHDLRRTAATGMAELGIQPHIIEAVLNHVSGHKSGVAGVYNRATYGEPMRDALQRWADHVEALTRA
jgi:integrase